MVNGFFSVFLCSLGFIKILNFVGLFATKQLETQGIGSLTGVIMVSFYISAFNCVLMQWELFSVEELGIVRLYKELSAIPIPDDRHLQQHPDILRITSYLTIYLTAILHLCSSVQKLCVCWALIPMSDLLISFITTNTVSYEVSFLRFVTVTCGFPRDNMVELLCIFKM